MTLLTDEETRKHVGVHALLIGVGVYPYLSGGTSEPKHFEDSTMGQLSSPFHSTSAFAEWLKTGLRLADKPLQSLRMLASSPAGLATGVDPPTIGNIKKSVDEWFKDVNASEENVAVFYFCGHGLQYGAINALLAEEFGATDGNPFEHSFEPEWLVNGMLKCQATQQLYIIDACTTPPVGKLGEFEDVKPVELMKSTKHNRLGSRQQAMLRASELGMEAFGNPNAPSVFMQAFIEAMNGAAATPGKNGSWVVKTNSLRDGVDWMVQRALKRDEAQVVGFGRASYNFQFHELGPQVKPIVPVKVTCEPEQAMEYTTLQSSSGHCRNAPSLDPWHIDLLLGTYGFSATDVTSGKQYSTPQPEEVVPPHGEFSIPCGDDLP
jgi:hypothetical protein